MWTSGIFVESYACDIMLDDRGPLLVYCHCSGFASHWTFGCHCKTTTTYRLSFSDLSTFFALHVRVCQCTLVYTYTRYVNVRGLPDELFEATLKVNRTYCNTVCVTNHYLLLTGSFIKRYYASKNCISVAICLKHQELWEEKWTPGIFVESH
jgi:hypothetical protein